MILVALAGIALLALYIYGTNNFNYWKKRGIKYVKPVPFLGNYAEGFFMKKSVAQVLNDVYWKFPSEKVVGIFRSTEPELLLRDPEIIKRVFVADFTIFYPRGLILPGSAQRLEKNLAFADGDLWRLLRQRMTPAFTSGKLRAMFPLVVERAARLQERALAAAAAGRTVDAKELMARYTTDIIVAYCFGLDADSLSAEDAPFRKLAVKIFNFTYKDVLIAYAKDKIPYLFRNINRFGRFDKEFIELVQIIMKQKNYQPSGNDFIDLLLECRNKGTMIGESIEKKQQNDIPEVCSVEMDDILLSAQVFIFFAAGLETSSTAMTCTLHQLAYHQDVQKNVHDELDRILEKYDNKLSYDAIKEMTYLEWTLKEGMRLHPPVAYLLRRCTQKYTFPELNLTIDAGMRIQVSLQGILNDPKYFKNPEEFRPERFDPNVFDNKLPFFLFGLGPRSCIGERLGMMQAMAGLAAVLARCSVRPAPLTPRTLRFSPLSNLAHSIVGSVPLLFTERKI